MESTNNYLHRSYLSDLQLLMPCPTLWRLKLPKNF